MLNKISSFLSILIIYFTTTCFAQNISDYLILNDIGSYKLDKPEKFFPGEPPTGGPSSSQWSGIIASTGHFQDHSDMTYEVMYMGGASNLVSPTVQVTQHTGGDSDQWLLHEAEKQHRNYFGIPSESVIAREVNGSNMLVSISGGGLYSWLSDNKVIAIKYHDLQLEKPEPIEVVQAYLAKFPSTLPKFTSTDIRTNASKEKWIKDEMERRLWLGGKWFSWQAAGNALIPDTLDEVHDHLGTFLDYREKYYGIKADSEKETLYQLLSTENLQGMKDKLAEYKTWWAANKSGSINLP